MQTDGSAELHRLQALVEADTDAAADLIQRIAVARGQMQPEPTDAETMALAAYVHHVYTAMEAALERIVRQIDGSMPSGPRSHRELLETARVRIPSIRPGVIGASSFDQLSRYLSFRHAYRHGYAMRIEWSRLRPLVDELPAALAALRADLTQFFKSARNPDE